MIIRDTLTIDVTKAVETPEGFIKVPATLARTGIQEYLAAELGLTGDPTRRVKVYRPRDEVFDAESMASFNNLPLTNTHPPEDVNKDNWKQYTVGWGGPVVEKDGYMVTDITITDADAIAAWKAGRKEISNGYHCTEDYTEGTTSDGEEYECVQRDIRGNHIALVDKGRCGTACRTDNNPSTHGGKNMQLTIDGVTVNIEDQTAASVVQTALKRRDSIIADQNGEMEKMKNEYDEMSEKFKKMSEGDEGYEKMKEKIDGLKIKMKEMEGKKKDADIATLDAMVESRMQTMDAARTILGNDYEWKGKNCTSIKRDAVAKAYPNMKLDTASDEMIEGLFVGALMGGGSGNAAPAQPTTDNMPQNMMAYAMQNRQDSGAHGMVTDRDTEDARSAYLDQLNGVKKEG